MEPNDYEKFAKTYGIGKDIARVTNAYWRDGFTHVDSILSALASHIACVIVNDLPEEHWDAAPDHLMNIIHEAMESKRSGTYPKQDVEIPDEDAPVPVTKRIHLSELSDPLERAYLTAWADEEGYLMYTRLAPKDFVSVRP